MLVMAGGAFGSGARYLAIETCTRILGAAFPFGTLAVNALGSFLAAFLGGAAERTGWFSPGVFLMLATGFLGGFTTYSTFNTETLRLFQKGEAGLAIINLSGTVFLCLGMGFLGFFFANFLPKTTP